MKWISVFLFNLIFCSQCFAKNLPLDLLHLPPGFRIEIFAFPVFNAREMTLGSRGTVFVGSLQAGNVYAIIPDLKNLYGHRVLRIASALKKPNGVAFLDNNLYVATTNAILRFNDIENHLNDHLSPVTVTDRLPQQPYHDWRFIRFGPDRKLYVGVGAPCNVCLNDDPRFATIMRLNADGRELEIFARGIRNTLGFDWDPLTHQLWFSDNGADGMGDFLPPDTLYDAFQKGLDFGFPYCYGKNTSDPIYGKMHRCSEFTLPALELPAHVAPLGIAFYTGKMFPNEYLNQLFIAEHGSWNRSSKIGYQVITVKMNNGHVVEATPFITGWLQGQKAWGRPVALLVMPDGSLLISDDHANVIYRVIYK